MGIQEQGADSPAMEVPEVARIPGAELCNATVDGVRWTYWQAGSGPPLLLIHGFMGYSFSWRFNVAELAKHFSVYAVDLPACGFSQRIEPKVWTLTHDAQAMLAFLDHLGIAQADVVATSRGGGVAIVMASLLARRNLLHRMPRLILVAPLNPWSSYGRALTRGLATPLGGLCVIHLVPRLRSLMAMYYRRLYGDPKRISPGGLEGYDAGLELPGSFQHLWRVVRSWHDDLREIEASLPAIRELPTLLLWGSLDRAVYPSSSAEIQRRLANSALIVIEGAGHLPYEETPEHFNRIVADFLVRNIPATPLPIQVESPAPQVS